MIQINGTAVSQVEHTKLLGVNLVSKLNWEPHIHYISKKISKGIGIICKARSFVTRNTLITLYYTFIYPYIIYCLQAWGNTYVTTLYPLLKLQKRIVRILVGARKYAHTHDLFVSLKILTIPKLYHYFIGIFMYKYIKGMLPAVFNDYFIYNRDIHGYNTRQRELFHPPLPRSELTYRSLNYMGAIIWNHLSSTISAHLSLRIFKQTLMLST
jgi:hypothetical protein